MKAILLAGAGAVGKTATVNALNTVCARRDLRFLATYSSTRETYARLGVTNERAALAENSVAANKELQRQVFTDNANRLLNTADQALRTEKQVVLADRTPYDYSAYWNTIFQSSLTLAEIDDRIKLSTACLKHMLMKDDRITIDVWFFPFPQPFSKDTESSDGWRADHTGKNLAWSAHLRDQLEALKDFNRRLGTDRIRVFNIADFRGNTGTELDRANHILDVAGFEIK